MNGAQNRHFRVSVILMVALLLVFLSADTGNLFHQVAGLVMGGMLGVHLIMHRKWLMTVLRRANQLKGRARTNFRLALALTVLYTVTIATGIAIIPAFHDGESPAPLTHLHTMSAILSIVLTLWHLGLHWSWLRHNAMRHRPAARHV